MGLPIFGKKIEKHWSKILKITIITFESISLQINMIDRDKKIKKHWSKSLFD